MPPSDHSTPPVWTRRRVLRTLFCSSAALALNVHRQLLSAAEAATEPGDRHWLMIGDFGSQLPAQTAVAGAMKTYLARLGIRPEALLLLGDNFYKEMPGGLESPRWRTGFEDMYPADAFPGPCPAILGNHDYGDNPNGDRIQLDYAQKKGTRWTMPHKWYRMDFPVARPLVTFLFLDTNTPAVRGVDKDPGKSRAALSPEEAAAQWAWLDAEFAKPDRAPWTIVAGHHPVYSNGHHGDTKDIVEKLAPRLQRHRVPLYLCGHDHDQQHLELEGTATSFVLSGCGGARVRPMERTDRGPYANPVYGFTHLQVSSRRLLLRHIDANGNQLHAFSKTPDGRVTIEAA